jgi:tripartite-type tricarboxylate transporter receptor subunit TctC
MSLRTRQVVAIPGISASLLLVVLGASTAYAQPTSPYPARPVRYLVGFTPGGGTDVVARGISAKLSEMWGQQVVVDNRPGASTIIATEIAAKSARDGYTLLHVGNSFVINPGLQRKLRYDTLKDFEPVTQTTFQPYVIVVHPSVSARTVQELIALARAKPGSLNFASPGRGSGGHLVVELFRSASKTDMVHVPYRGGAPALADLLGGQIQLMFATSVAVRPHLKAGRLRTIAVTSARRSAMLPDVPTVAEAGLPGFDVSAFNGVVVPAGTPPPIVAKLASDIARAIRSPDVADKFAADGAEPVGSTPQDFARYLRDEIRKWAKVLAAAGIRAE